MEGTRAHGHLKTMEEWHADGRDLAVDLEIGDRVSGRDTADTFSKPTAGHGRADLIQIGEPNDHIRGRATFATTTWRRPRRVGSGWVSRDRGGTPNQVDRMSDPKVTLFLGVPGNSSARSVLYPVCSDRVAFDAEGNAREEIMVKQAQKSTSSCVLIRLAFLQATCNHVTVKK